MDLVIEYIALFRNKKAENNIGSDFEVITDIDNELILRMLKLTDKKVAESTLSGTVEVVLDKYKVTICYDDSASKGEEKALLVASLVAVELTHLVILNNPLFKSSS